MTAWVRRNNHPFILSGVSCALAVLLFELLSGFIFGVPDLREEIARMKGLGDETALRAAREALHKKLAETFRPDLADYLAKASFSSHLADFPDNANFGAVLEERIDRVAVNAGAYARAKGTTVEELGKEISFRAERTLTAEQLKRRLSALAVADRVIRLAADHGLKQLRIRSMQAEKARRTDIPVRIEIEIRGAERAVWNFLQSLATPGTFLVLDGLSIEIDRSNPEMLRVRNIILGPADTSTDSERK